jgi:hypothetical protein
VDYSQWGLHAQTGFPHLFSIMPPFPSLCNIHTTVYIIYMALLVFSISLINSCSILGLYTVPTSPLFQEVQRLRKNTLQYKSTHFLYRLAVIPFAYCLACPTPWSSLLGVCLVTWLVDSSSNFQDNCLIRQSLSVSLSVSYKCSESID